MAIEFNCPHCATPYKLKDELAGKKATCKNPNCRQVITVPSPKATVPPTAAPPPAAPGAAPKPAPKPVAPKPPAKDQTPPPHPSSAEIDAAALAALADAPKEERPAEAPIPVVCAFCDHKWTEPREKGGKNVLCPNPECRQRNKVPVPKDEKPKNWREADQGPSLRKELFEKPSDVVTSGNAGYVGKKALDEAGAFDHELEPVPLKRRLFFAALVAVPVLALVYGVYAFFTGRSEGKVDVLVADALKQHDVSALPPAEGHLVSALLYTSAGQYELHETEERDKALKRALDHFTKARDDLRHAAQKDDPKKAAGTARYAVGCELALAQLALGGTDDEVKELVRYRWVPDQTNRRLRVNEKTTDVHTELQRTLQIVLPAEYDLRAALARRLTRELVKRGKTDLAADLPTMLFAGPEQPEAKALVALEVYRLDKAHPFPKQAADDLKATLAKGAGEKSPFPGSAAALWKAMGTEKAPNLGDGKLTGAPSLSPAGRAVAVSLALLDGRADDAIEAARRSGPAPGLGSLTSQLQAAVAIAEWGDAGAAFDVALVQIGKHAAGKKGTDGAPPPYPTLRLAQLAAAAGKPDAAKQFADAIGDDGLRAWAKADVLRLAATAGAPLDPAAFEAPDDPAKLRAGHAWGRFWVARHNARVTGDRTKELKLVTEWPRGTVQPLGLIGIALGLRER